MTRDLSIYPSLSPFLFLVLIRSFACTHNQFRIVITMSNEYVWMCANVDYGVVTGQWDAWSYNNNNNNKRLTDQTNAVISIRMKIQLMLIDSFERRADMQLNLTLCVVRVCVSTTDQFQNHQINEMRLTDGPLICFWLWWDWINVRSTRSMGATSHGRHFCTLY